MPSALAPTRMASTTLKPQDLANAIRALAMDAVQKANSGHPGMPMGMAEIAEVLWRRFLRHNPANPAWAGPRPLRALQRARLDAAVRAAAPHGLRGVDGRPQGLPPDALEDAGASGVRHDPGRGDDDRAAGPGTRQRGGHGARGEAAGRRVQPPRAHHRRPPDLRLPGRRLPHGGHLARGVLARGHAPARQARRPLRRQRHLDRRARRRLVHRQHADALRKPTAGT